MLCNYNNRCIFEYQNKRIEIMTRFTTITEAADKVRDIFTNGISGTTYFILEIEGKEFQIRVSDHSARSHNNKYSYDGFFSFISAWNNQDCNMTNEWLLDEDGDFTEEFVSVEDCLEFNIF